MAQGHGEAVEIRVEPVEHQPIVANLMQLYLHDFSAFAAVGTGHGELGPNGRFAYEWLDLYWTEDGRTPLTIWAGGRLAGLALINRRSYLDRPLDQLLAEFFVVRKYRRHRVGSRAAGLIFTRFPGRWEVPVAAYNAPALAFWRRAIPDAIGRPADKVASESGTWAGSVLCFETKAASSSQLGRVDRGG